MKKLMLEEIHVQSFITVDVEDLSPGDAEGSSGAQACISCGCGSAASWFGPPQICCMM